MILVAHQLRVRRALLGSVLAGAAGEVAPAAQAVSAPDRAPARSSSLVAGLRGGPMVAMLRSLPGERPVPATNGVGPGVLNPVGSA